MQTSLQRHAGRRTRHRNDRIIAQSASVIKFLSKKVKKYVPMEIEYGILYIIECRGKSIIPKRAFDNPDRIKKIKKKVGHEKWVS